MAKMLTEQQVKDALQIDSFRNLSKVKIMELAFLIPNMDKNVAISMSLKNIHEVKQLFIVEKKVKKYMEVLLRKMQNF